MPSSSSLPLLQPRTGSQLAARRRLRPFARIGFFSVLACCVWLLCLGSSSSGANAAALSDDDAESASLLRAGALFQVDHLKVLTTKRFQRKTAAALALHRKQALLGNFPPSAVEDRTPPAAQVVVQQPPPTTVGEAGVPIFRTATTTNSAGLFLVWPRNGTDLSTSSFLLQSFLSSPSAHNTELVIIVRGSHDECESHRRWISRQERKTHEIGAVSKSATALCLDETTYWKEHRDYLCKHWGCSPEQSDEVLEVLIARGADDINDDDFKMIRGLVFDRYLERSSAKWWGWVGHEQYLGNLQRQMPWDIARNFDVLVPNAVDLHDSTPVGLSRHLALFQRRKSTEQLLLNYPSLKTREAFLAGHRASVADISNYFVSNPSVTFLAYEAYLLPSKQPFLARAITQLGSFAVVLPPASPSSTFKSIPTLDDVQRRNYVHLLLAPRAPVHLRGTFSDGGRSRTGDGPAFSALSVGQGSLSKEKEYYYRLNADSQVLRRVEPRSWSEEHPELVLEFTFDLIDNHRLSPSGPPPYPPRRLVRTHALAFPPVPLSSTHDDHLVPHSSPPHARKWEVWDANEPSIREALPGPEGSLWWTEHSGWALSTDMDEVTLGYRRK